MKKIDLSVQTREITGKHTKSLRQNKLIPAVIYGQKKKNINIQIPYNLFLKTYKVAGENTVLNLQIDGKKGEPVLIYEIETHPVTDDIIHIDFLRINMDEAIETTIPLTVVGTSEAVKSLGGVLITQKDEILVKCLPSDLIHEIEVDISSLIELNDTIHIKDLNIPKTLEVLDDLELTVAQVLPPKAEEEKIPETEATELTEGEKEEESADENNKKE